MTDGSNHPKPVSTKPSEPGVCITLGNTEYAKMVYVNRTVRKHTGIITGKLNGNSPVSTKPSEPGVCGGSAGHLLKGSSFV